MNQFKYSLKVKIRNLSVILTFITFISMAAGNNDLGWKLVGEEPEIKVYTRDNPLSEIKEIRIELRVKSTMDQIERVLSDVPGYTNWVYKCSFSTKIEDNGPNSFYYYVVTDFPFPFDDRDLAVKTSHWIDNGGVYHSETSATPAKYKVTNDMVRITEFKSKWTVTPQKNDWILVEYEATTSPGGHIPSWLVNLAITKGPLETIRSFKSIIEKK